MESQDTSLSPHREKVALALAIVKSQPAEVSLREYILRIRRHIQEGRRQLPTQTLHRYVDGVAFWRDCYEKAKEEQTELRLRIDGLERIDNSSTNKPKRRKNASFYPRKKQKKGAKSSAAAIRKPTGAAEVHSPIGYDLGVGSAELEGYGNAAEEALFMRHLYYFCQLLQDNTPNLEKLSSTLVWLSSATAKIISSVCDLSYRPRNFKNLSAPSEAPQNDGQPFTNLTSTLPSGTLFRALTRVFAHLIRGFDTLNNSNENTSHQGQVTYSLVKLFSEILDGIQKVSVRISQTGLEKAIRTHGDHQGPEQSSSEPATQDPDPRPHLCRMLAAMLTHLDATKPGHTDLADGFLSLLLQRAGQRLHFFVFDDEPHPHNSASSTDANLLSRALHALNKSAVRDEAKYLIWTLKRAMAILHRQPNSNVDSAFSLKQPDKSSLAEAARTRLQYTLLRGVFGAEVEEFGGGLRMPAVAETAVDVDVELPTVGEEETAEWFKRELWALCGWEVLGRHVEFGDGGF